MRKKITLLFFSLASPMCLARLSVCASEANSQHAWAGGLSVLFQSISLTHSSTHSTLSATLRVTATFLGKPTHQAPLPT